MGLDDLYSSGVGSKIDPPKMVGDPLVDREGRSVNLEPTRDDIRAARNQRRIVESIDRQIRRAARRGGVKHAMELMALRGQTIGSKMPTSQAITNYDVTQQQDYARAADMKRKGLVAAGMVDARAYKPAEGAGATGDAGTTEPAGGATTSSTAQQSSDAIASQASRAVVQEKDLKNEAARKWFYGKQDQRDALGITAQEEADRVAMQDNANKASFLVLQEISNPGTVSDADIKSVGGTREQFKEAVEKKKAESDQEKANKEKAADEAAFQKRIDQKRKDLAFDSQYADKLSDEEIGKLIKRSDERQAIAQADKDIADFNRQIRDEKDAELRDKLFEQRIERKQQRQDEEAARIINQQAAEKQKQLLAEQKAEKKQEEVRFIYESDLYNQTKSFNDAINDEKLASLKSTQAQIASLPTFGSLDHATKVLDGVTGEAALEVQSIQRRNLNRFLNRLNQDPNKKSNAIKFLKEANQSFKSAPSVSTRDYMRYSAGAPGGGSGVAIAQSNIKAATSRNNQKIKNSRDAIIKASKDTLFDYSPYITDPEFLAYYQKEIGNFLQTAEKRHEGQSLQAKALMDAVGRSAKVREYLTRKENNKNQFSTFMAP